MDNKSITVREFAEKIKQLEKKISGWAKAGMRAYTANEMAIYKFTLFGIEEIEKNGVDLSGVKDYWNLHAPTQHNTIKELKPIDEKGGETEVFDKVVEKISKGDGDENDYSFIKEIEKRTGLVILSEEVFDDIKSLTEKREMIKKKMLSSL